MSGTAKARTSARCCRLSFPTRNGSGVEKFLSRGVRAVIPALVLRQTNEGPAPMEAGAGGGISARAAWEIRKRKLVERVEPETVRILLLHQRLDVHAQTGPARNCTTQPHGHGTRWKSCLGAGGGN